MVGFATLMLLVGAIFVEAGVVTRSNNDIANFRDFLEKTVDGKYEEPSSPELADLQNDWENSGKFEGDIVLTSGQMDSLVDDYAGTRNAILNPKKLWPNNTLYYNLSALLLDSHAEAIEEALQEISKASCVTFQKSKMFTKNYVNVVGFNSGCYSSVGMVGGVQTLNLAINSPGSGCWRHGTIVHEFLHALGFYHMQSTYDRDDYVRIVWDKIKSGTEHNFNKYTSSVVTNHGVEYDYESVLHYSEYGFSTDGNRTIVPLKETSAKIGQRMGLSDGDITKLNRQYNCPGY